MVSDRAVAGGCLDMSESDWALPIQVVPRGEYVVVLSHMLAGYSLN